MKKNGKWTIVVPTIREDCIKEFLAKWESEFKGHRIIVVEDNPEKSFDIYDWVEHYSWEDIDKEFGPKSWIIPRRSDTIRSYGYYKASKKRTDYVLTVDDDCYPERNYRGGFLKLMQKALEKKPINGRWWNTLDSDIIFPRGYPHEEREAAHEVILHHGLWSNVPDLDAVTQMKYPKFKTRPFKDTEIIPWGKYFPMCGMNVAFKAKAIPAMYFLLMGKDSNGKRWPYDRAGDVWCGLFIKKISDHLGHSMSSGAPSVHHSRASNVDVNFKKEKPTMPVHEKLWKKVDAVALTKDNYKDCYIELANKLDMNTKYWKTLRRAMREWALLF